MKSNMMLQRDFCGHYRH